MPCSAVVFDLDGVVADTESFQLKAFNTVLKPFGVEITDYQWATLYVGTPVEKDLAAVHARFHLPVSLDVLATERQETYSRLLRAQDGLKPTAGLLTLLDYLEANKIPAAIASGSPRADVNNVLNLLEILPRFRAVVSSDDVPRPKPAPDVYLRAAADLGVLPGSCAAVEDSATGMIAAKTAGMTVIGFPSKFTQYQELHPDLLISSLDEIRAVISKTQSE
jgi:HAD superfamily hydrolase (TIGR01509 family)